MKIKKGKENHELNKKKKNDRENIINQNIILHTCIRKLEARFTYIRHFQERKQGIKTHYPDSRTEQHLSTRRLDEL